MTDLASTLTSLFLLLGTASFMIVIAFALSSFSFSRFVFTRKGLTAKIIIGTILGALAIYGTLMGTKLADGTIVNVRELAVMIAGVTGGPFAGLLAGLIGGIHRFTVGGATALPCTISTIAIGLISGLVSTRLIGKMYLVKGVVLGVALESAAMGLILVLVSPFDTAVAIVSQIAVPMIAANTIGLVLWMYLFNRWNVLH
jgi:sigma-B regulation protein RsbU (phosphoserine phosphatase)